MKTKIRLSPHSELPSEYTLEVWHEGALIGQVTGSDAPGIRFISKYDVEVVRVGKLVTELIVKT